MEGLAIFGGIIAAGIFVIAVCCAFATAELHAEQWWHGRQLEKRETRLMLEGRRGKRNR